MCRGINRGVIEWFLAPISGKIEISSAVFYSCMCIALICSSIVALARAFVLRCDM